MKRNLFPKLFLALVLIALAVPSCKEDGDDDMATDGDTDGEISATDGDALDGDDDIAGDENTNTAVSSVSDGSYIFIVESRWTGESEEVDFPSDLIPDDDYEPVDDGTSYPVVLSDNLSRVSIGETPMIGEQMDGSTMRQEYNLTEGTFAGGYFAIWKGETALEAELTIFGSGRPVISSERGRLERE